MMSIPSSAIDRCTGCQEIAVIVRRGIFKHGVPYHLCKACWSLFSTPDRQAFLRFATELWQKAALSHFAPVGSA
jgi:hypothetical protein